MWVSFPYRGRLKEEQFGGSQVRGFSVRSAGSKTGRKGPADPMVAARKQREGKSQRGRHTFRSNPSTRCRPLPLITLLAGSSSWTGPWMNSTP